MVGLVVGGTVPAQHGREADDDGQHPADGNDAPGTPARYQAIVSAERLEKKTYNKITAD